MTPVPTGKATRFDVEIYPSFAQLRKGHRLRLTLRTSDLPHLLPLPQDQVDLAGRRLPGRSATRGTPPTSTCRWRRRARSAAAPGRSDIYRFTRPVEKAQLDCRPAATRCLARRSPIGPRGIGRVRLGRTRARLRRLRVQPSRRTRYTYRYCVRGGSGRVTAVFSSRSRRGKTRLITTTARGHGNRRVRVRSRASRFRRAYRRRVRVSRGVYRASPGSPRLFGVRRGRVRFIAVASRDLLRSPRRLRRYLRRAGLRP